MARGSLRAIVRLSIPITAGQLITHLLQVATIVIVASAHDGGLSLARATYAGALYSLTVIFGSGVSNGIAVYLARSCERASGNVSRVSFGATLRSAWLVGLGLASLLQIALLIGLVCAGPDSYISHVVIYTSLLGWSIPPIIAFRTLKSTSEAEGKAWEPLCFTAALIVTNTILSAWFFHGGRGLPGWGLNGIGAATVLCRYTVYAAYHRFLVTRRPDLRLARGPAVRLDKTFVPQVASSGLHAVFEAGLFSILVIFVARLGQNTLASHGIAMTLFNALYMLPSGIGAAVAVLVAKEHASGGTGTYSLLRAGSLLAIGICLLLATLVFFLRHALIASLLHGGSEAVARKASAYVAIGCIALVFDGMQAVFASALRAFNDAVGAARILATVLWLGGLPVCYALAIFCGWGGAGIWWGMTAAFVVLCAAFGLRLRRHIGTASIVAIPEPQAVERT